MKHLDTFPRLKERLTQYAGTMSGGEQQQLIFARAIILRPRVILIDEPSLGFAPAIVEQAFKHRKYRIKGSIYFACRAKCEKGFHHPILVP